MELPQEQLPYIKVPLHTLIRISPRAYGCEEERYSLPIEAVDTHRPKPSKHHKDGSTDKIIEMGALQRETKRDYFGETSHIHTPAPIPTPEQPPTD